MNLKLLNETIDELNICNAAFGAVLRDELAIIQSGNSNKDLLKDIQIRSEKCRKKMDGLKDAIFKTLMESGWPPSDYLVHSVSEFFRSDESYAAASKIAALIKYYEIINIRVDEDKIIYCISLASKGSSDLLAEVLSDMRRDFRDFYTWGRF